MQRRRIVLVVSGCLAIAWPAAAEYREVNVDNGGSITGHVHVTGEVPALPPQPVFKEQEVCGTTMRDERLIVGSGGALRNAVVHLTEVKAGKAVPRERPVALENAKCAFVPHVATAAVGQTLTIHNSDPFLHDAHALIGARTLFNIAVPKGKTVRKPLAYPGLIHINCNVRHTWMHAYLFVAEHPYHAVTGDDGGFVLDGVPPGKYTLSVWHELLGSVEREVEVQSGKVATADIALPVAAEIPSEAP